MERIDDLGCNGYKILQDSERFCFGIDAVLLSGFSAPRIKPGQKVLDMGTGTGIIPILLSAKTGAGHFSALEIQEESVQMAKRSVEMNKLSEKIDVVHGDIKEAAALFGAASFDVCTCNPPYMTSGHGLINPSEAKMIARHEILCSLEDVVSQASKVIKPGGLFFMVHRPFRLCEIINSCIKYGLEPKRIRFVHPYVDKEPNMVLIEAKKGGASRVTVEKPLIVYKAPGEYTDEIYDIYKPKVYDYRDKESNT